MNYPTRQRLVWPLTWDTLVSLWRESKWVRGLRDLVICYVLYHLLMAAFLGMGGE